MKSILLSIAISAAIATPAHADWTGFRGSQSNSVSPGDRPPTSWNDEQNIAWRIDLPGRGPSSPLVVGDRVFLTASSGVNNDRMHVLCYSTVNGKQLWERQFWATGHAFCHKTTSNAAPTPVSDGEQIYAFFSSNDLVCLDLDGNFKWFRGLAFDRPKARNDVGMASSPVVVDDVVIAQVENKGDSFVAGIDTATGETRWLLQRTLDSNWCSPILLGDAKSPLVLLQAGDGLTAVRPDTGEVVWHYKAECATIPSCVAVGDKLLAPANGITAVTLRGDETPVFAWNSSRLRPQTNSPVVHEGRVYVINGAGVLACGSLDDGDTLWQLRLTGPVWSTPVLAGDHLYVLNGKGLAQVVKIDDERGQLVATHDFGEPLQATAAVADSAYYVRSDRHLWKIAE
jgi:outer membrane protein assembly factor BamB